MPVSNATKRSKPSKSLSSFSSTLSSITINTSGTKAAWKSKPKAKSKLSTTSFSSFPTTFSLTATKPVKASKTTKSTKSTKATKATKAKPAQKASTVPKTSSSFKPSSIGLPTTYKPPAGLYTMQGTGITRPPNFTGKWYLDRTKSESTDKYLEAMGLPPIARQAAERLNLVVYIHQTETEFSITRRTKIFKETKVLKFNHEVVAKSIPIRSSILPDYVEAISQLPNKAMLIDKRRLLDNGLTMHVELDLRLPGKAPVITHRYFSRAGQGTSLEETDEDEEFLLDEPIDEKSSKRKR